MFTLSVKGTSLEELYANLETLLRSKPGNTPLPTPQQPAPLPPIPTYPAPPVPPVPPAAPSAPVAPPPLPTAPAPTFTIDQLAQAGAALAQSDKLDQALALLAKYGVSSVTQLPPEQHGAFATELRALGAPI